VPVSENQKGPASAFATLSSLRPAWKYQLFEWLALANARVTRDQEVEIRNRTFLHHALWVKVPAKRLCVPAVFAAEQSDRPDSLLFLSYFTDDLLDYLRGFTDKLSTAMNALWGPSEGWKGAESYGETKRYVLEHRWRTDVYFNGRQKLNVGDARVAVATRLRLDKLATMLDERAGDLSFERAYEEAVRAAFENTTRFAHAEQGERP